MSPLIYTNLLQNVYVQPLLTGGAVVAATYYPASTAFFDCARYEKIGVLAVIGATFNSATTLQLRQDKSATATAALKDVTNAVITIAGAGMPGKFFYMEVRTDQLDINNGFRYVTLLATGPAGGDDLATILLFGINPDKIPTAYHADLQTPVIVSD